MTFPLKKIKVLDLSRLAAGNLVSHMLADYGADVIKVERPEIGDDLRTWKVNDISLWWHVYSRNKRSLSLNFRTKQGNRILCKLIKKTNVLIENFLPGTLEKWGFNQELLDKLNPNLIVVRISGWGQTGLYKNYPGYGSLVEGMSGFASMSGEENQGPLLPPTALADMICGLSGVSAIMFALYAQKKNEVKGQVIDLSLFEPLFSIIGPWAAYYKISGEIPKKMGNRSPVASPRNIYKTKDSKYVSLSASMQSMWEKLAKVIKREDLISDDLFLNNEKRVKNQNILDPIIAEFMIKHNQSDLLQIFKKQGITVGPVLDISDLIDHPYIKDREILINFKTEKDGIIPMHNVFPRLSVSKGEIKREAPTIGQDNNDILLEMGFTKKQISVFKRDKII